MTAAAIADLLHGRPACRGKWAALCSSHEDRNPSLSITEGADGRVLLHCHAGCPTDAVLKAVGLRMADLFAGPPPTPAQARVAAQEHERRESEARGRRMAHGRACDELRKLERIAESLAGRLTRLPDGVDGDALAVLFHATLDKVHAVEVCEIELRP